MSASDIDVAFRALLATDPEYNGLLPESFKAKEFIEEILGFVPTTLPSLPTAIANNDDNNVPSAAKV